jgi:hypothetical protein
MGGCEGESRIRTRARRGTTPETAIGATAQLIGDRSARTLKLGSLCGGMIPMSALRLDLARAVDLDEEPGLRPWLRVIGVGMPIYHSGSYRLKDRERALVFQTRSNLAVYIPTSDGYALLLTPERPADFLAALQAPPPAGQTFAMAKGR